MDVITFPTELLGANCYMVVHQGKAIVIDPAGIDLAHFEISLAHHEADVIAIVNTHGHIDHTFANDKLKKKLKAPIMIHEADSDYLTDPQLNLSAEVLGIEVNGPSADQVLFDNQQIKLGDLDLTVIHTPGHTPGGICLLGPDFLLTGDTLFRASIGRSDLPGGNSVVLKESITRLKTLEPKLVVYPGHGPQSTIEYELVNNSFMR